MEDSWHPFLYAGHPSRLQYRLMSIPARLEHFAALLPDDTAPAAFADGCIAMNRRFHGRGDTAFGSPAREWTCRCAAGEGQAASLIYSSREGRCLSVDPLPVSINRRTRFALAMPRPPAHPHARMSCCASHAAVSASSAWVGGGPEGPMSMAGGGSRGRHEED
jgi:hypothetical protein